MRTHTPDSFRWARDRRELGRRCLVSPAQARRQSPGLPLETLAASCAGRWPPRDRPPSRWGVAQAWHRHRTCALARARRGRDIFPPESTSRHREPTYLRRFSPAKSCSNCPAASPTGTLARRAASTWRGLRARPEAWARLRRVAPGSRRAVCFSCLSSSSCARVSSPAFLLAGASSERARYWASVVHRNLSRSGMKQQRSVEDLKSR